MNLLSQLSSSSSSSTVADASCGPIPEVKRICLIRPSALGDVCRTVPILATLKQAYPAASIDWVVQDSFVPAIIAHPGLAEAIPFPRQRFGAATHNPRAMLELIRWLNALRKRSYDIVYDCQGLARSGFFTWCTRAPRRIGFRDAREFGALGYTHRLQVESELHTVDRMLGLLAADGLKPVPAMQLYVPSAGRDAWNQLRQDIEIEGDAPYAVLAPTSRWAAKQWSASRFVELLQPIREHGISKCFVVGSASERSQIQPLLKQCDGSSVVDLVGKTDIGGLMAVIADASLVIANDSAPLHMAVGFNRRYVALFGPTDTARVGPYGGDQWVVQHTQSGERLHHKDGSLGSTIMDRISVKDVIGKIGEAMSENRVMSPRNKCGT